MPELPEIECAAQQLRARIPGRKIRSVEVMHRAIARGIPAHVAQSLAGCTVLRVDRRAKYQLLALSDERIVCVHFRMTGEWSIGTAADAPPRYERLRIVLDDNTRISLVDPRALSNVGVHSATEQFLPPLGMEPTDPAWSGSWLRAQLSGKRGPIKLALLDQRIVAGLGNIYATEALWESRIHPAATAGRLSAARVERLAAAARLVLEQASGARYYGAGERAWTAYDREGEACERCESVIRRIVQSSRSSYFCGRCQRR